MEEVAEAAAPVKVLAVCQESMNSRMPTTESSSCKPTRKRMLDWRSLL